ncbi:hypothetical protein EC973_007565 [Apophysomyces ossiformis]|uniref:Major facilitator superfamily (MFS) profile domain-containing protein n=1 Tax=Apophysomyces ossiformis TaxID=679940 RepID=A0A8H7BTQ2_9FUNG|nr:hypothetical protein EC973_007565 [Apophysomyces ossiformis]
MEDDGKGEEANEKDVGKSEEEAALVRKIDIRILPILCSIACFQYLDKTAINYAAILHLKTDLQLDVQRFNFVGAIFYIGYLITQRIPLGRYIGLIVFFWGAVLVCTGFVQNYSQLLALRFVLGFFEGGIYPAFTLLVATFYRRREQATRLSYIWLSNGVAVALGGLMAYGIGLMDDHGMARWRWLVFIFGTVTCFIGFVAFFFLSGNPKAKRMGLTAQQEALVDERIRDNQVYRTKTIKREQQIEALKEIRLWAFSISTFVFGLRSGGMSIYETQITHSFGYSELYSILLTFPYGIVDAISLLVCAYIASKINQTLYVASAVRAMGTIGTLLMIVIPNEKLKIIGQYISACNITAFVLLLSSLTNNVAGYTKKVFYSSIMMGCFTVANIAGPFVMAPEFAPTFVGSFIIHICTSIIAILCLLLARWRMAVANRRKAAQPSDTMTRVEDDLTDVQDPNFVYRL